MFGAAKRQMFCRLEYERICNPIRLTQRHATAMLCGFCFKLNCPGCEPATPCSNYFLSSCHGNGLLVIFCTCFLKNIPFVIFYSINVYKEFNSCLYFGISGYHISEYIFFPIRQSGYFKEPELFRFKGVLVLKRFVEHGNNYITWMLLRR